MCADIWPVLQMLLLYTPFSELKIDMAQAWPVYAAQVDPWYWKVPWGCCVFVFGTAVSVLRSNTGRSRASSRVSTVVTGPAGGPNGACWRVCGPRVLPQHENADAAAPGGRALGSITGLQTAADVVFSRELPSLNAAGCIVCGNTCGQMSRNSNSTESVPSYWYHFASYWTVSYYLPEREGEVKAWINLHYQVCGRSRCATDVLVSLRFCVAAVTPVGTVVVLATCRTCC